MKTSVQTDFHLCDNADGFRSRIHENFARLVVRFARITMRRVFIRGLGEQHRMGGAYERRVHLELPDRRQVNIDFTSDEDERHRDPLCAIYFALKPAPRALQDNVRRFQGHVELDETALIATARSISPDEGSGLLENGEEREFYFHQNSVFDGHIQDIVISDVRAPNCLRSQENLQRARLCA